MRKVSIVLSFVGVCLIAFGIYSYTDSNNENKEEVSFNPEVHKDVTEEDKKNILNYLNVKYGEGFKVVEHTTKYCLSKEDGNYVVDKTCEKKHIVNNIYKVQDSDDITFYVKNVTFPNDENYEEYFNNSYYDNYVTFNVTKKVEESLTPLFKELGDVKEIEIYDGIGVEYPQFEKVNDDYKYYIMFSNLNKNSQDIVNKDMEITDYINRIYTLDYSNKVKLYVKYDLDINSQNFKEIVNNLKNGNFLNLNYGLEADSIILEFNNNIYLKYNQGFTFELLKYDKNLLEEDGTLVYDKKITLDFSDTEEGSIFFDDFMNLESIDLKL